MKTKSADNFSKKEEICSIKPLNPQWDKCLDDYNNYLKEYVKHYKKSINGNVISLLKYPEMKAKSEAILERLSDAQNKALLTRKQIKRIAKIQTQIANPLT